VRIWGRIVVGGMAVFGSSLAMTGAAWATPSHPGGIPDTCPEVLAGGPTGGVQKLTSPPAGSEVSRGMGIEVTLRWDPARFATPLLHKALDCVTVNGQPADDLSLQARDPSNDGVFTTRMTVPARLADGTELCDRGFVSGPAPGATFAREKSNDVCFTVRGDISPATMPAVPTTPAGPQSGPTPSASTPPAVEAPAVEALGTRTLPTVNESFAPAGPVTPGTDVAGAGDVAGQQEATLPKTGADVGSTALIGLGALLSGSLARYAGRRHDRAWRPLATLARAIRT
jgi:LPXTG-motif cell wall-anchored protein